MRPLRRGRQGDRQADPALQHPVAHGHRHAQRPARRARADRPRRAASSRPTTTTSRRSTASTSTPATTTCFARALDMGGAGGIRVASHIVGDEMRRMVDEPERRAEIDAELRDVYAALFITRQPRSRIKAALELLGLDVGGLRLPLVEADEARARRRSAPCSSATACWQRHAVCTGTLRVLPLGGLGEIGKNMTVVEYDGPHRRRRHRPAVPDRRDARHRPRAARLHLPARARRRHRGDRHHARPRGPPRRAAVGPARARAQDMPRSTAAR